MSEPIFSSLSGKYDQGWELNANISRTEGYWTPSTGWTANTPVVNPADTYLTISSPASAYLDVEGLFFKPDGLKMYIASTDDDSVSEYNLSAAWDVSTASYSQVFSLATQDSSPRGLFFTPDGLKMYVLGNTNDNVLEYNLGTAWDISTTSYSQSFSVATQDTNVFDIFFKPDGLKMYVVGSANDSVYEYNLGTAWDISTASYLQTFDGMWERGPEALSFRPDGLKMYIGGVVDDYLEEYDLGTAWDISTASRRFVINDIGGFSESTDGEVQTIFFNPDGLKMYVGQLATVFTYDLS